MPIFEYYCTECKEVFEELVFNPDEIAACPRCQLTENVQKCVSAVRIGKGASMPSSAPGDSNCRPGPFT